MQAIANSMLAHKYAHKCRSSRVISGKVTHKTDDSVCYVTGIGVLKVTSSTDTEVTGYTLPTEEKFEPVPGLDFTHVLAFKLSAQPSTRQKSTYPLSLVVGKCVVADGIASVVPWDVLFEH